MSTPMPAPEWAAASTRTAAGAHRSLRDLSRQVLRRAQSPAVFSALGHQRRTRRRHRARQRLAAGACAGRFGPHPRVVSRRLRRAPRAYGALRTRDVPMGRQGMYVREFPPQMDWQHISEGLSVFNLMGLSTPDDASSSSARAVSRLLRWQRPGGAQLRPETSRHPQHVQRQHRPPAPADHGAGLGGRSLRCLAFQAGARRAQLRRIPGAFPGIHRHGLRQPAEPAIHHAGAQRLSIDRREALARLAAVVCRCLGGTRRRQ